jgi:hypothetical protein
VVTRTTPESPRKENTMENEKEKTKELLEQISKMSKVFEGAGDSETSNEAMADLLGKMMQGAGMSFSKSEEKRHTKKFKKTLKGLNNLKPSTPWYEAIECIPPEKQNKGVKQWLRAAQLIQRNQEICGGNSTTKQSIAIKLKSYSNKISEVSKDKKAVEWAMNLIEIYSITCGHALHFGMIRSPYVCKIDALNILNHNATDDPAGNRVKITQKEHVICLATLICMYFDTMLTNEFDSNCIYMATELAERLVVHFKPDAMSNPDVSLLMLMNMNPSRFIQCHYRIGCNINRRMSRIANTTDRQTYFLHQKEMLRYAKLHAENYPKESFGWYFKGLGLAHSGPQPDFQGAYESFETAKQCAIEQEDDIICALASIDMANVLIMGAKGPVCQISAIKKLKNDFETYAGKCASWNNGNICVGWPLDPGNLVSQWLSSEGERITKAAYGNRYPNTKSQRPSFPNLGDTWNNDYTAASGSPGGLKMNRAAYKRSVKSNKMVYCFNCKKEEKKTSGVGSNFKRCARCKKVLYCSTECQRHHWKKGGHKKVCKKAV